MVWAEKAISIVTDYRVLYSLVTVSIWGHKTIAQKYSQLTNLQPRFLNYILDVWTNCIFYKLQEGLTESNPYQSCYLFYAHIWNLPAEVGFQIKWFMVGMEHLSTGLCGRMGVFISALQCHLYEKTGKTFNHNSNNTVTKHKEKHVKSSKILRKIYFNEQMSGPFHLFYSR